MNKFDLNEEVWFKNQNSEEEGYYIISIAFSPNSNDTYYVAEDCNYDLVVGKERDFEKVVR